MAFQRTIAFLLTALLIGIGSTPVMADDQPMSDWDEATASQIHQHLADQKAASLADKMASRRMAAAQKQASNQTEYDVRFYDIDLRIDDTTEMIYGEVRVVAGVVADSLSELELDFHSAMTVDSITSPVGPRLYVHDSDILTVTLDRWYAEGEVFEFTVGYHGHPTEGGFQGFSFDTYGGAPMISSLSEPYFARSWWPCKDRMDDKADSFDIAITVDTALYSASNGTLDSTIDNGDNTHSFYYRVRYPMVTYLFSVAITDYTVWYDEWTYNGGADTMPLVHAVYPDFYTYSLPRYGVTPYALTVLSDNYGLYPFVNEKYGHANFEWGGAMEHQTMSSMAGSSFGFSEPVLVHELSHQWWGDMITCESWSDIWLNEGWASYSEAMYYYVKDGFQAYKDYMADMAYSGGGTIYVYDTTSVWNIFHGGLSYDKGAWVVHMLRGMLGDSLFFAGVEAYYNSEHQYGSATTEDFRNVWEQTTGWELDWFFNDWIMGTYRPYYKYSMWQEASDSGGVDIFLWVKQTQTTYPQVFHMPVPFVFHLNSNSVDTTALWCDERRKLFRFNYSADIGTIECDPDNWVLKYAGSEVWGVRFVTISGDLDTGMVFIPYNDTLQVRGGSGDLSFNLVGGALPGGMNLSSAGHLTGTPADTGGFAFTVRVDDNMSSHYDELDYTLYVEPIELIPGDVDLSLEDVNVADLVYLLSYMFQDGPPPPVSNLADVDASCQIDIADLVYLVSFMFQEGPAPVMGCVE